MSRRTVAALLAVFLGAVSCGPRSRAADALAQETSSGANSAPGAEAGAASKAEASTPLLGPDAPGQPAGWDSDLRLPEATDTNPDPNVVEVTLEARLEMLELQPGLKTEMWTYNGSVPGPIIRTKKGDTLIVHVKSSLPEPTTIHWHGVRVPNAMDGSTMVQKAIPPGGSFDYTFVVPDAGTFWYHPHVDSSAQVGFGLYGPLIVEDPSEPPLGDELVLMLSDVSLNADGSLMAGNAYGWFGDYFGREGATLLVNGKVRPKLLMRPGTPQRWRIINATRARYEQVFAPGLAMTRIGSDQGLSNAPVDVSRIFVTPGEREELYVVPAGAAGPATSTVTWKDPDRLHIGAPEPDQPLFDVQVTNDAPWTGAPKVPAGLGTIQPLDLTGLVPRTITFDDVLVADPDGGPDGGVAALGIDGKSSTNMADMATLTSAANTVEHWMIVNHTSQDHPFHLHGYRFQVLSTMGVAAPALEWRDTANLPANGQLDVAVQFDDRTGMWMLHCHILDHAEMGMMAMLMVTP